jgi:hypothetical protein
MALERGSRATRRNAPCRTPCGPGSAGRPTCPRHARLARLEGNDGEGHQAGVIAPGRLGARRVVLAQFQAGDVAAAADLEELFAGVRLVAVKVKQTLRLWRRARGSYRLREG